MKKYFLLALFLLPGIAFAQTSAPQTPLSNCFDYYAFNSTPVSLSPSLSKVAAGAPIAFSGEITNRNAYPIVDATIWVKIFRARTTGGSKDPNGPDVVDFFRAVGPITLRAGESLPVSFLWDVPKDAQSGNYQAATYVVSAGTFNLSGLTFTDDVTGSLTGFSVVGGQTGHVGFDKTSITVGGTRYFFAANAPTVSATSSVPVRASIVNSTGVPAEATLTWDLYSWDSVTPGSLISEEVQRVLVAPHATMAVAYTARDTAHSVYYLVGTLTTGDSKSIVGIRFVRSGIDTPLITFAGVSGYPLSATSTLFMCVHDTNASSASDAAMTLQIVPDDPVERFFDSILGLTPAAAYAGSIPSQEVALTQLVEAQPSSFTLVARLYQHGVLVEDVSIPYACGALGVSCGYVRTEIELAIILLVLLAAALFIRRHARPRPLA